MIERFQPPMQIAARELILSGLQEHWGSVDPTLNPDLGDISANHDVFLVALGAGGTLVGTAGLREQGEGTAEVVRMSVAATHRRRGVGRMLLAGLIEAARSRDLDRLVLETTAGWQDVRSFWEATGFRFSHEEEGRFGTDAYYELWLNRDLAG
ncbi:MAG: GNAT family N-acetyltransferase [Acidimicrobiales bacterium]